LNGSPLGFLGRIPISLVGSRLNSVIDHLRERKRRNSYRETRR
jgi:hypothetical protein